MLDRSESGNPSYRAYVSVYLDRQKPGRLDLNIYKRAAELDEEQFGAFSENYPITETKYGTFTLPVTSSTEWLNLREGLDELLSNVASKWSAKDIARKADE